MEYQLSESIDHINREERMSFYSCVCCPKENNGFDPGHGAHCDDTGNDYCYDCISVGNHFEYYMGGDLTLCQIFSIDKEFKPL